MGALTAAAPFMPFIREGVNAITGAASREASYRDNAKEQQIALRQLQATQRLNQQHAEEDAALQRERLAADAAAAESTRLSALRRAVARQRANFGAQGVGSEGGSAGAVLLGFFDESAEELAQREKVDGLRSRALDLGLSQQRGLNTLQFTQLKERQKIGRLGASVDRASGFVNSGLDLFDAGAKISNLF